MIRTRTFNNCYRMSLFISVTPSARHGTVFWVTSVSKLVLWGHFRYCLLIYALLRRKEEKARQVVDGNGGPCPFYYSFEDTLSPIVPNATISDVRERADIFRLGSTRWERLAVSWSSLFWWVVRFRLSSSVFALHLLISSPSVHAIYLFDHKIIISLKVRLIKTFFL
jgi:hypothetical protein